MSDSTESDEGPQDNSNEKAVVDLKDAVQDLSRSVRILERAIDIALGAPDSVVPLPQRRPSD